MLMIARLTLIMFLTVTCVSSLAADSRESVMGLWASEGSIFRVHEVQGELHGTIIALNEPVYSEAEDSVRAGRPRLDDENPDPQLRDNPLIGLEMFASYIFEDNVWRGRIYDPESGNTYQSKMQLNDAGQLEIRGYIGIPMFGRTARFEPVSTCQANIVKMLAMTHYAGQC